MESVAGFIGTAERIEVARAWLATQAEGVNGDAKNPEFPGWMADRGFFSTLEFADSWNEELGQAELRQVLETRSQRDRFEAAVQLFDSKLRMLAERDNPPEYIVIAMSEEIVSRCGTADYTTAEHGAVHRDLRRALKANAMKYRIPTQLLQSATA